MKTDENDNGTMASLYNHLDRYADRLKCCFVLIHHTSKGNQSAKEVTDVGAGAGAQSRATDTHLVLRKHEEEDGNPRWRRHGRSSPARSFKAA